jgi:hypothetical protein
MIGGLSVSRMRCCLDCVGVDMVKLRGSHPAMTKFGRYLLSKYNSDKHLQMITAELVTRELRPYNGSAESAELDDAWLVRFDTEQDLTFFVLRWS